MWLILSASAAVPTGGWRQADDWIVVLEAPTDAPFEGLDARPLISHAPSPLNRYWRVRLPAGSSAIRLAQLPGVEETYQAFAPVPPPAGPPREADWGDIPPVTPSFAELQTWFHPAPAGLGFDHAWRWPGGMGEYVAITDVEYSWDPEHEDLSLNAPELVWGLETFWYTYHGNATLGVLGAADIRYGTRGGAPRATLLVASPFELDGEFNLAAALLGAMELLVPGDVLLIEQQASTEGGFAPVSVDPAVFDAIALAVERGITVVEPAGNGGRSLDDPELELAFDRSTQDSGSILVGAAAADHSWSGHSNYGSRIDVHGWVDGIVAPTNGDFSPNLWFPGQDSRQAYTDEFGGTSGASAQTAAAAAVIQSVSLALYGEPIKPKILRQWLAETGWPQPATDAVRHPLGSSLDVETVLRTYLLP